MTTSVHSDVGEVLIDEETLRNRIVELGAEVSADYEGRDLLLVGVLKGAIFFISDLMRELTVPCEVDFMAISSYGAATDSLEICALHTKPERREVEVPVRYVGYEIPNRFVIGYGLDFAERYRNLPYIGVLHPDLVPNGL